MGSQRLEIFKATYKTNMKVFLILSLATLTLASCGHAHPGGYTAKGGVVDFRRKLDYMKEAQGAAKLAWDKQFESELTVGAVETSRGERDATYIPTFFTSQQNHEALTNSRNDNLRPQRNVEPLYYETYHNQRRR